MKKLILITLLTLMLSPSFAYYTITKKNKGPNGYFRVCETHGPSSGGGSAHILICEAPGETECSWTTVPPKGEQEGNGIIIEIFVLDKISENVLSGQAIIGNSNFIVWSAVSINDYTFTVYTITEAQQLGLLN